MSYVKQNRFRINHRNDLLIYNIQTTRRITRDLFAYLIGNFVDSLCQNLHSIYRDFNTLYVTNNTHAHIQSTNISQWNRIAHMYYSWHFYENYHSCGLLIEVFTFSSYCALRYNAFLIRQNAFVKTWQHIHLFTWSVLLIYGCCHLCLCWSISKGIAVNRIDFRFEDAYEFSILVKCISIISLFIHVAIMYMQLY